MNEPVLDEGAVETPSLAANADMVVSCELDLAVHNEKLVARGETPGVAELPDEEPLLSDDQIEQFAEQWRRMPYLRALIRAVSRLRERDGEKHAVAMRWTKSLRALDEMGRSDSWKKDPKGRLHGLGLTDEMVEMLG